MKVPILSKKFACRWDGKKLFLEFRTEKGAKLCVFSSLRYTPSQIFVMIHDFQVMVMNYENNYNGQVLRPRKHQCLRIDWKGPCYVLKPQLPLVVGGVRIGDSNLFDWIIS